ncbi:MAG: 30S ribosomal protein S6 [Planctomycetota bacterium]
MESDIKKLYEGMFLIDSAEAAKDWDGILELINRILTKADAEIVSIRKWDERPLAYTIRRCARGTYILTYFRSDGKKIHEIERDVQLSERIMRVLILRADHLTEEAIAKDTPATSAEKRRQASASPVEPQSTEQPAAPEEEKPLSEQVEPAGTGNDGAAAQ